MRVLNDKNLDILFSLEISHWNNKCHIGSAITKDYIYKICSKLIGLDPSHQQMTSIRYILREFNFKDLWKIVKFVQYNTCTRKTNT